MKSVYIYMAWRDRKDGPKRLRVIRFETNSSVFGDNREERES